MELQGHEEKNRSLGQGGEQMGQGGHPSSGGRDYPALGVLILLLAALLVTGYLSFQSVAKGYDFKSELSIKEWIQGLEEKARDLLRQGERIGRGKRDTAKEHLLEGYRLHRKKRYAKALQEFDKAIQMNKTNPEAYYWRGRTLISQGRFEPAVQDFQTAAKLKPDYAEAYDHLGWLYERLGQTDNAIDALSRSIELKPDNGWAFNQRGRMLFRKGDRDGALRDAEKACSLGFEDGCKAYEKLKSEGKGDS